MLAAHVGLLAKLVPDHECGDLPPPSALSLAIHSNMITLGWSRQFRSDREREMEGEGGSDAIRERERENETAMKVIRER